MAPHTTTSVAGTSAPAPSVTLPRPAYAQSSCPASPQFPTTVITTDMARINNGYKNGGYTAGLSRRRLRLMRSPTIIRWTIPLMVTTTLVVAVPGFVLRSSCRAQRSEPAHDCGAAAGIRTYEDTPYASLRSAHGRTRTTACSAPPAEVKPGEPTVLVFRNGKQQEVTNYAIMGDSLYVFDQGAEEDRASRSGPSRDC